MMFPIDYIRPIFNDSYSKAHYSLKLFGEHYPGFPTMVKEFQILINFVRNTVRPNFKTWFPLLDEYRDHDACLEYFKEIVFSDTPNQHRPYARDNPWWKLRLFHLMNCYFPELRNTDVKFDPSSNKNNIALSDEEYERSLRRDPCPAIRLEVMKYTDYINHHFLWDPHPAIRFLFHHCNEWSPEYSKHIHYDDDDVKIAYALSHNKDRQHDFLVKYSQYRDLIVKFSDCIRHA